MSKGTPIPVRFEAQEAGDIALVAKKTGLAQAEVIRRACRLLYIEFKKRGAGFIIDLIEPDTEATGGDSLGAAMPTRHPAIRPEPIMEKLLQKKAREKSEKAKAARS